MGLDVLGDLGKCIQQKHPAGLKTALIFVHFFQNQKMLNHKSLCFYCGEIRILTMVDFLGIKKNSRKMHEEFGLAFGTCHEG